MKHASTDTTVLETHFKFGRNWASYAERIGETEIQAAVDGLLKLVPKADLAGRTFLDIGSGSGLHALAAARVGASRILTLDIDPESTATTRRTLEKFAGATAWTAETRSIFATTPGEIGAFDVVYSWGVLHHTGDMMRALDMAANLVAPGGIFAFALYRRTRLDGFWRREKHWYANARPRAQQAARGLYTAAYSFASTVTGRRARMTRGMEYWHDLHDWLGGYPYEAILAGEVEAMMRKRGFRPERVFARPLELGLFGSGCDEYVYRRTA